MSENAPWMDERLTCTSKRGNLSNFNIFNVVVGQVKIFLLCERSPPPSKVSLNIEHGIFHYFCERDMERDGMGW